MRGNCKETCLNSSNTVAVVFAFFFNDSYSKSSGCDIPGDKCHCCNNTGKYVCANFLLYDTKRLSCPWFYTLKTRELVLSVLSLVLHSV